MRSTFGSYEIGRKGMTANRYGTEVAANNIANAATRGFSRRRVQMTTSPPNDIATTKGNKLQIGSGVDVVDVYRLRSEYSDAAFRRSNSDLNRADVALSSSQSLDSVFGEPGDTGLSEVFNKFWSGWSEAAKRPEDEGLRAVVLGQGRNLTSAISVTATRMDAVGQDRWDALQTDVMDFNGLMDKLAQLNRELSTSVGQVTDPSDRLDERDRILDDMSKLMDIKVSYNSDRSVSVIAGGQWVVDRNMEYGITLGTDTDGTPKLMNSTGSEVVPSGGSIGGYYGFLSDTLPSARNGLNELATDLRDRVNAVHMSSYADPNGVIPDPLILGKAFFIPSTGVVDAAKLDVGITSPQGVAVNSLDSSGKVLFGEGAKGMAALKNQEFTGSDGVKSSITSDYAMLVSSVGRAAESAQRARDLGELTLEQDEAARDELSAVNTDEEMVEMLKFESGYNAAAKVITMMDEMVQTILDMVR